MMPKYAQIFMPYINEESSLHRKSKVREKTIYTAQF